MGRLGVKLELADTVCLLDLKESHPLTWKRHSPSSQDSTKASCLYCISLKLRVGLSESDLGVNEDLRCASLNMVPLGQ